MSSAPSILQGILAPSVRKRALTVLALLVGFYFTTFVVIAALFATPVVVFLFFRPNGYGISIAVAGCWIPAVLLVIGVANVRRPRFDAPSIPLRREEAPAFFALVEDLATQTRTAPPTDVYLTPNVELSVAEVKGARVLCLGLPMLSWISVEELRAGLAHELGHFAFGDTRLSPLIAYAHAMFGSMLVSTHRTTSHRFWHLTVGFTIAQWLGGLVVVNYAKFFFAITGKQNREAELAADQLAARLARPDALRGLLDKVRMRAPLHDAYLEHVGDAIDMGAVPTNATEGYTLFVERTKERGLLEEFERKVREKKQDVYDTHPSFDVRAEALRHTVPVEDRESDARPAGALFAFDVDARLVEEWSRRVAARSPNTTLRPMTWAEMPTQAMGPYLLANARRTAEQLYWAYPLATTYATMLDAVLWGMRAGHSVSIMSYVAPIIASEGHAARRAALASAFSVEVLIELLIAALLERGATLHPSLGEPGHILTLDETRVCPREIVEAAQSNGYAFADLVAWGSYLVQRPTPLES